MALNKYAAIRYRIIDQCIRSRSKPYPSKEDLRSACEEGLYGSSDGSHISMSTIDKDLWAMKNESAMGYAPIAFSRQENGYFYLDPDYSLNLPLTQEDIGMIRLAMKTLTHFRQSRLFQDLETAVNKIEGRILVAGHLAESGLEEVIQFESVPANKGHEFLPMLIDAIRQQKEIEFRYTPHVDGIPRRYLYHPYLLKEHKNIWYLVGLEKEGGIIRTLGLDRMEEIRFTGSGFSADPGFDPLHFFRYSFGVGTYSGVPEEIIIRFDSVQSRYIIANPIHSSQEVIEELPEGARIRLFVIPTDDLKMQILSYGNKAVIESPPWLRQEISGILESAASQYRPEPTQQ
ncbi:MAG: WYL domain-containing protein [Bacteroidales bacterium]|nr:WYL domain-containing protein [Bacteroidales bacterium]MDD3385096.1 WYL domain-containing protein [Bacteroidales bacterium]MDD3871555.1 WYL domain-containing protein [Bacteroidales bacterium]